MIIFKLDEDEFPYTCGDCPLCDMNEEMTRGWCGNQMELDENDIWYRRNRKCPLIKAKDIITYISDRSDELQINDDWDGSGD